MHEFTHAMAKAVEDAIKRLLSEKHLYQYVEPDLGLPFLSIGGIEPLSGYEQRRTHAVS
jgi:lysozyme family protein